MKRLLRVRLSLLLLGLTAIPLAALPFAERIREEWRRWQQPRPAVDLPIVYADFVVTFAVAEPEVETEIGESHGCTFTIDPDLADYDAVMEFDPFDGAANLAIEPDLDVDFLDLSDAAGDTTGPNLDRERRR